MAPLYMKGVTTVLEASWSCSLLWWDLQPSLQSIIDSLRNGSWFDARPSSRMLIYMLRFANTVRKKTMKALAPNPLAQQHKIFEL